MSQHKPPLLHHLTCPSRPPTCPLTADVQVDKAHQLAAELGEGNAIAQECDVSQEGDIERLVQAAVDKFGGLDIMCNNAGAWQCWQCCPAEGCQCGSLGLEPGWLVKP